MTVSEGSLSIVVDDVSNGRIFKLVDCVSKIRGIMRVVGVYVLVSNQI